MGEEYLNIHRDSIVADLHCDTILRMRKGYDIGRRNDIGHIDLPRMREGGVDLQIFACFVHTDMPREECRPFIDGLLDTLEAEAGKYADDITLCSDSQEVEVAINESRIAAIPAIENGVAINSDLKNLEHFYNRGVRYLGLTHTASCEWVISSGDRSPAFDGLTDFGRDVVRAMNELGMIVDVSHASVRAVEKVLETSKAPIIASHSNVHAICPHDRNLTDEQLMAIANQGGMIGVNFFPAYLAPDNEWFGLAEPVYEADKDRIESMFADYTADFQQWRERIPEFYAELDAITARLHLGVKTIVDHIDYIVKLVGDDYVGLGSDFDGISHVCHDLSDISMLPNITGELIERSYHESSIRKILGGNFLRVFHDVCD